MQSLEDIIISLSSKHAGGVNLGLSRIENLLSALGHPEEKLPPTIHVAGTNGKGSVIAFLRAMAEAEGLKVHTYTSPHLVSYRERITLASEMISEEYFCDLLKEVGSLKQSEGVSFFELITAASFLGFSRISGDLLLLETGLGGRLDATNVVSRPLASIITSISRDHMQYLGETLEAIAREKICILKRGSVGITARARGTVNEVFVDYASKIGSRLLMEDIDWEIKEGEEGFFYNSDYYSRPSLIGRHQYRNAGLAITCASKVLHFCDKSIRQGLATAIWPCRLELLQRGELFELIAGRGWEIWLDGAHNEGGAEALKDFLPFWGDKGLHLICGMLTSKEANVFMNKLSPFARSIHTVSIKSSEHIGYSGEALGEIAKASGMKEVRVSLNVKEAVKDIMSMNLEGGRILICGSLYLLGEILANTTRNIPSFNPISFSKK